MQSKFWIGVLLFAGLALVAFAQDEGGQATATKAVTSQTAPASNGAEPINEGNTGTVGTALESIADDVMDGVDGALTEAPDLTSEAKVSSAPANDNYTPTERISEDRSVSFPVDI